MRNSDYQKLTIPNEVKSFVFGQFVLLLNLQISIFVELLCVLSVYYLSTFISKDSVRLITCVMNTRVIQNSEREEGEKSRTQNMEFENNFVIQSIRDFHSKVNKHNCHFNLIGGLIGINLNCFPYCLKPKKKDNQN